MGDFRLVRSGALVDMARMCLYNPLLLQVALVIHNHPTIWRKVLIISLHVCILTSYIKVLLYFDPHPSIPFECSHMKTRIVASGIPLCLRLWVGYRVCVSRKSQCDHQNGRIDSADTSIYWLKEENTWMGFEKG